MVDNICLMLDRANTEQYIGIRSSGIVKCEQVDSAEHVDVDSEIVQLFWSF